MAKARELMAGASYDPATVAMMGKALEEAWADVAENYKSALAVEAARLKLANIILSLAADGERDPQRLKDRAVRTLTVDNP